MVAAADLLVAEALQKQGWSVLVNGWPDILAYDDRRRTVMAVELKRGADKLRPAQVEMARVFVERMGVPFYVARDDDIAKVMRRRGRVVAPGQSLQNLQWTAEQLQAQLKVLQQAVRELEVALDESTVVFEAPAGHGRPAWISPADWAARIMAERLSALVTAPPIVDNSPEHGGAED